MAESNNTNKVKGYPEYAPSQHPKSAQPYDLYGDDISFDEANSESGWSVGPSVSAEEYDLQKNRTFNEVRDPNTNIFRYGLWYDVYSNVEDPTLLGFTCEIDDTENSPLFGTGEYSARGFIEKYSGMPEIAAREELLTQFQRNIKMVFRSMESTRTSEEDYPYVKSHYLERVVGLKALTNKFTKYKEDELVFTMHEDVTMFSQYLAQLYNNLAYSYRNGKMLIPENLLRFNLVIKISEIRNFKTVVKSILNGGNPEDVTRKLININSSQLRYTLYDCNFNFFESQNHGDDMQMSGIGSAVPSTSKLEFKLHFKHASRLFKSEIIDDLDVTTNARTSMNDNQYDPKLDLGSSAFFKEAESQPDFNINREPENDFKKNEGPSNLNNESLPTNNQTERDENRTLASQNQQGDGFLNGKLKEYTNKAGEKIVRSAKDYKRRRQEDLLILQQQLINRGASALRDAKNSILEDFRRKRGELLNILINEVKEDVGFVQIIPKNVYTDTFDPTSIQTIINDLGSTVGGDLEDFIRGFNEF